VLQTPEEQLTLFPMISEEEWADLDGQDQLERFLNTRLAALKNERTAVEWLLAMAARTEAARPDVKAETSSTGCTACSATNGIPTSRC
jgi:hypothetical protein